MYTVAVEAGFTAAHRLRLRDCEPEPSHEHDWHVRANFAQARLDQAGMVVDFRKARSALESVLSLLNHTDLNDHAALAGRNPTAEVVARYVFERLGELGFSTVRRVEVTEDPGCVAIYEPDGRTADRE